MIVGHYMAATEGNGSMRCKSYLVILSPSLFFFGIDGPTLYIYTANFFRLPCSLVKTTIYIYISKNIYNVRYIPKKSIKKQLNREIHTLKMHMYTKPITNESHLLKWSETCLPINSNTQNRNL